MLERQQPMSQQPARKGLLEFGKILEPVILRTFKGLPVRQGLPVRN